MQANKKGVHRVGDRSVRNALRVIALGWVLLVQGRALEAQQAPVIPAAQSPAAESPPGTPRESKLETDSKGFTKRPSRVGETGVKVHFDVSYCEQKDPLQLADVYMPAAGDIEHQPRFPAIIAIHGGAWISGDKRFDALHCRKMAQKGYVVMAINYRLAPKHKHPAQIDDCREALRWLHEHAHEYHIDPDRLGVWGYSAGGHLAALMATDRRAEDPPIRVCVAGGAPCDLGMIPEDSRALAGFLGGTRRALSDVYSTASPIEHVSSDDPPILLYHGDADELVPIAYASKMHKKLQECGVACEYLVLPGKSHIMAFVDAKGISTSIDFFDRHLKR
ncbi:MAG: alpha/beta hydrolase [Pirellula sp.]|nr:alpha/beta hydrolase [Pirellula sp.]